MRKFVFGVLIFGLTTTSVYAEKIWENLSIKLNSGKYIWATLEYTSSCYQIHVGSPGFEDPGFGGVASNCSQNVDGYWSVKANGNSATVNGGVEEVITKILEMN